MEQPAEMRAGRPKFPADYGISTATEGLLTWGYVVEQMMAARNYWIGSTQGNGRPHAAPVWGLWIDEAFYFSTDPRSVKGRNLTARPDVVVHLESGDDVVILEGQAEQVLGAELPATFADLYEAKYQIRVDVTDPNFGFFRVVPQVALAWHEHDFPQSTTRWVRDAAALSF